MCTKFNLIQSLCVFVLIHCISVVWQTYSICGVMHFKIIPFFLHPARLLYFSAFTVILPAIFSFGLAFSECHSVSSMCITFFATVLLSIPRVCQRETSWTMARWNNCTYTDSRKLVEHQLAKREIRPNRYENCRIRLIRMSPVQYQFILNLLHKYGNWIYQSKSRLGKWVHDCTTEWARTIQAAGMLSRVSGCDVQTTPYIFRSHFHLFASPLQDFCARIDSTRSECVRVRCVVMWWGMQVWLLIANWHNGYSGRHARVCIEEGNRASEKKCTEEKHSPMNRGSIDCIVQIKMAVGHFLEYFISHSTVGRLSLEWLKRMAKRSQPKPFNIAQF